ncbi:duf229 domain containing protein [Stylonychia lemnae]|uniref:Duf229 domain containing protein n=1 Tax=Stylonychia lemnae TaxID=5949 RepID=A0A077ZWQ1_STYLE|nr:duf229 domain containing protein [Stylonychia lemnae]|eukprot:CDW74021.1 duf229 domain containing protein [Stylonychia lemnae]
MNNVNVYEAIQQRVSGIFEPKNNYSSLRTQEQPENGFPSFVLFLYELKTRINDYQIDRNEQSKKFIIFLIVDFAILLYSFSEVSPAKFGGVYCYLFLFFLGMYLLSKFIQYGTRRMSEYMGKIRTVLIISFLILVGIRLFFFNRIYNSCANWKTGISQGIDESRRDSCNLANLKYCPYEITDDIVDLSAIFSMFNCENFVYRLILIQKYYPYSPGHFYAHPLTKYFNDTQRHADKFPTQVLLNTKGYMTLQEALDNKHEVIIDIDSGQMHTSVQRNETLVEERREIRKNQNRGDLQQHMLLVFIDTLSRPRLHVKMPETVQFLRERDHKEFMRLHAIWTRTQENALALLYGIVEDDLVNTTRDHNDKNSSKWKKPDVKLDSIFDYFHNHGFITGYSANTCETNIFYWREFFYEYVKNTAPDHEHLTPTCDPHLREPTSDDMDFVSSYASARRCVYHRDSSEYMMDYYKEFKKAYQSENTIFLMNFMETHEGTGEVIDYLDKPLAKFLKEMEDQNTALILFSDHGLHMSGFKLGLGGDQAEIERYYPFLITSNIRGLSMEHERNLDFNTQKVVTHLHLRNFLMYWASGQVNGEKMNLINQLPHDNDRQLCDWIGYKCICDNFPKTDRAMYIEW